MVGEDHCVGAEQAEQLADQQRRRDIARPGHRRMGEERHVGIFAHQRMEVDTPAIIGATSTPSTPASRATLDLRAHLFEWPDSAADSGLDPVAATAPAMLRHALGERAVGLVGEAMIVLDEIQAASGDRAAILASPSGGRPCGFSAEQVSARLPAPTSLRNPARPGSGRRTPSARIGKFRIRQHDVGMHGGIAEQHVDQLPGFQPGGGHRQARCALRTRRRPGRARSRRGRQSPPAPFGR